MTWDHERVEELLAARVLGGLEGEDADLAERALVEHLPQCARCRESLAAFERVAGDLALLATPVEPPATVRAKVRRATGRRVPRRSPRRGWAVAAVAAAAAVALAGWNVSLMGRLSRTEIQQGWLAGAVSTAGQPDASSFALTGQGHADVTVMHDPRQQRLYVIAARLPQGDGVYRVWFVGAGGAWTPGTLEPGDRGWDVLPVRTDLHRWHRVMVTHEPDDGEAPAPQVSPLVSATLDP